jgi:hypothetical protein
MSIPGPNILLSTMLWNILSLCSFHRMRDKISPPYKTVKLQFRIFRFLNRRQKGKIFWK